MIMNGTSSGAVWLVGAGPGAADLITVRGLAALRTADVVVHDRLISHDLLAEAPAHAERIDVGKAPGAHRATQDEIHDLLLRHAGAGRRVVRLKGGDPYVYGRGFEERDALLRAGVEVHVVPGLTAATAVAAAAGVPVTLRGVARTFGVLTPAVGSGAGLTDDDYEAAASLDTVCIYMGVRDLAEVSARLIAAGREPHTPVAVIENGATPSQRVTRGELTTIAAIAEQRGVRPPALIIIGPVAAHADDAAPADHIARGPLQGRTIVVTRPIRAGRRIASALRAEGASVIEAPLIRITYETPALPSDFDDIDWFVFTSLHGVIGFKRALDDAGRDVRSIAHARFACVGPKTATMLHEELGVRADLMPFEHRARALVEDLAAAVDSDSRVAFPCGTLALDELPDGLAAHGVEVRQLRVYDTLPAALDSAALRAMEAGVDAVLLYSPTAVRSLAAHRLVLRDAALFAIGPTTAAAIDDAGLPASIIPSTYSDEGMREAVITALTTADIRQG